MTETRCRRWRALAALAGACAWSATQGQSITSVSPLVPDDGGVAGPKPVFRIAVDGTEIGKMRFRIVLSDDDFDTAAYTFDQKEDSAGWSFAVLGGEQGAMYRATKPLAEGRYRWRADAWNGVDWGRGERTFEVRIDATPPADVTGLRTSRVRDGLRFDWDAVYVDREGRSEQVVAYHVYRYARRSFFFVIRAFQVATTTDTSWTETDPRALAAPMLFYKVTAEDAAGNEPDRRY